MADAQPQRAPPSEDRAEARSGWFAHLRGLLLALHVIAVLLLSTPDLDGGLNRESWKSDTIQHEVQTWAKRLGRPPEEIEDKAWRLANGWSKTRKALLTPVRPYADYAGPRQRWRMFAGAERTPARLHVEVQIDGQWQIVHQSRSREYDWQATRFDRERIRVIVGRTSWPHRKGLYKRVVDWVASLAAADFPEATRVRVCYLRAPTPTPAQRRAGDIPEGKLERCRRRSLEALR